MGQLKGKGAQDVLEHYESTGYKCIGFVFVKVESETNLSEGTNLVVASSKLMVWNAGIDDKIRRSILEAELAGSYIESDVDTEINEVN